MASFSQAVQRSDSYMVMQGNGTTTNWVCGLLPDGRCVGSSQIITATISTGLTVPQTCNLHLQDFGGSVILTFLAAVSGTSDASGTPLASSYTVPVNLRPLASIRMPCWVLDNNVAVAGSVQVGLDGSLTFYVGYSSNFQISNSHTGIPNGVSICWAKTTQF